MPLYEYQCNLNHHRFEARHGINEVVETCPECGSEVRRVIHPVGIVFKGSGFYATDSRRSSSASNPSSESKSETKAESTSESKSETAAGSESKATDS